MSAQVRRLDMNELRPDLAGALAPRVKRLGYLGEFFRVAGHQPDALIEFQQFTEASKKGLDERHVELIALTVATLIGNAYERNQHERLSVRLGFGRGWVAAVERLDPDDASLDERERAIQAFVLQAVRSNGRGVREPFERVVDAIGQAGAVAVLMVIGRYLVHGLFVNTFELAPPVPSIFEDGFGSMSAKPPLWITEREVVALMDLGEAIAALEDGLREAKAGRAINMGKTHAVWDGSETLHAIGGVLPNLGFFGTKTWGHTHGGATPLFLLWEAGTGRLAAIIEAFALGQMRTGGTSGVATRWMADAGADELAIIGSGKQALAQVAAVALVRPLNAVRVYSPNAANRAAFVDRIKAAGMDLRVRSADSVADAVRDAPIITTVTRACEPFMEASMVSEGTHINAVGAITPERRELGQSVIARCRLAVADDPDGAGRLAAEFATAEAPKLMSLAEIVDDDRVAATGGGISIFKAMGMGLSDLALAVKLYERARARNVGRSFDHPTRAAPRLWLDKSREEEVA